MNLCQFFGLLAINSIEIYVTQQLPILSILLTSLTWVVYVEYTLEGVIFRPNRTGICTFTPSGIIELIKWSLTDTIAWRPEYWDLNYIVVMTASLGIQYNLTKNVN